MTQPQRAVDLMVSFCFRVFGAVKGLRPPEAARERAPLTAPKTRKGFNNEIDGGVWRA